MQLIVTSSGSLHTKSTPGVGNFTTRTLPSGITVRTPMPCHARLGRFNIITGRFDPALVYDLTLDTFYKIGITRPAAAPTIVTAAGTHTGRFVGYFTFVAESAGNKLAESGLSDPSAELVQTAQGRQWTTPTTATEARVTHKYFYGSWNGALPRYITKTALGTATLTEDTRPLQFGALSTEGGLPRYTAYCESYRQRIFLAGDPDFPSRIYYGNFGDGENYAALAFLQTTSGEAVTGMKRLGEVLVIFTYNTIDVITGLTAFEIFPRASGVGCISHFSIKNIHDRLWFAGQEGVFVYDGAPRFMMDAMRDGATGWVKDYEANTAAYEQSFAEVDYENNCYLLHLNKATSYRYVGYYLPCEPQVGGGEPQPWWFIDKRDRKDTAIGRLTQAAGSNRTQLYVGSSDGYLRQENYATDGTDDGDTFQKGVILQTKHFFMNDPGGDEEGGKTLQTWGSYVESEAVGWQAKVLGGDESAENMATADSVHVVSASAVAGAVAKTVHPHPVEQASGRGFSFFYSANLLTGWRWRGLYGSWTAGPANRGRS